MITIVNEVFFLDLEGNVKSLKGEIEVILSGSRGRGIGRNFYGTLISPKAIDQIRKQREYDCSLKSFMLDHALKNDVVFWQDENIIEKNRIRPDFIEDFVVELDDYPISQYIQNGKDWELRDRLVTVRAKYLEQGDSVEIKFFENGEEVDSNATDRSRAKEIFYNYFWGEFEASHDRYIESLYG